MNCKCAKRTDQYYGYICSITEGACMYLVPDQDMCAEQYGEVEHTKHWNKDHIRQKQGTLAKQDGPDA